MLPQLGILRASESIEKLKTIQIALDSWPKTLRFCLILLVSRVLVVPLVFLAVIAAGGIHWHVFR
jgi:hypothetical protein